MQANETVASSPIPSGRFVARIKNNASKLLKPLLFCVCLIPLLRAGLLFSDAVNPIEFITRSTGTWALVGLLVTLSITPLRQITGWNRLKIGRASCRERVCMLV